MPITGGGYSSYLAGICLRSSHPLHRAVEPIAHRPERHDDGVGEVRAARALGLLVDHEPHAGAPRHRRLAQLFLQRAQQRQIARQRDQLVLIELDAFGHRAVGPLEPSPQRPPRLCLEIGIKVLVHWRLVVAVNDATLGGEYRRPGVPRDELHGLGHPAIVVETIRLGLLADSVRRPVLGAKAGTHPLRVTRSENTQTIFRSLRLGRFH